MTSERKKAPPNLPFQPFGEGQDELCNQQKRRTLIRVWLMLLFGNILLLIGVSLWAVHQSHEREKEAFGKCYLAPREPQDRRRNKNQLTIANFNAEWLFLRGGHGDIRCPSESCPWATKKEARLHLQRVARVLIDLDADIVNLNEIEDCDVLDELLALMPADHGYKYYMVQGDDVATGQNPGILTRIDPVMNLQHSTSRTDFPVPGSNCKATVVGTTGCTKHYITRFNPANRDGRERPFVMAGFHLLAKPHDLFRCGRREAQAAIIHQLVEEYSRPGDRVILAGDFNDFDNETLGPSGEQSITRVLPMLKSGLNLVNTAARVPQKERYSCWFDKDQNCIDNGKEEHTLIDHVLISRDWTILDAAFFHKYAVSCRDRVSDHWPFKVTLSLE